MNVDQTEEKVAPTEEEDKLPLKRCLLKIQAEMGLPVDLSEVEKERFNNIFEALKGWLDDARTVVLEKERDEAYRYVNLLIAHLQRVDVDFVAAVEPPRDPLDAGGHDLSIKIPPVRVRSRVVRPTKEQVDGWLSNMIPAMREKAPVILACLKQYLDPESDVGLDVICPDCSPDRMVACIRAEDPSIVDSMSVFMDHQIGRG